MEIEMKNFKSFVCLCSVLVMVPLSANAQQKNEAPTAAKLPNTNPHHIGMELRASKMIGMTISNPSGKNVGKVSDLVLDAETGKIRYAAVTYGGFLGIGDKLFAVPYEAFVCKADPNDPKTRSLVLDVTQKQLEGTEGFDENNWPDFADQKFLSDLDTRYNVKRTHEAHKTGNLAK
jgi:sporulation protein YlmC with PRC-barrel domain